MTSRQRTGEVATTSGQVHRKRGSSMISNLMQKWSHPIDPLRATRKRARFEAVFPIVLKIKIKHNGKWLIWSRSLSAASRQSHVGQENARPVTSKARFSRRKQT
ncbi:hypothetical protein H310_04950 [Aphanomyces invadans]|uniref:Uncharacterized protein n=1 Tax=Aphanomyces invadans TaxID=157072 RepID=A0A024UBD9_9STRA|nr:hypothetical protein H310_04950 [Aphanomyces invadans]ETW03505.1 hypothetical protein H310_04950 [Aphanomyces invadans]|eukprot:XP_008867734.1 hypothetical protein H310_04950 [Aphanomyces invadans]